MQTIFGFILLVASSFGVGRLCMRRMRFARPAEEFVFSSALGMAILSYAVLLLGAVGGMTSEIVTLLLAVICLFSIPACSKYVGQIRLRSIRLDLLSGVCLAVLVGAAALNAACTLNPILEVDTFEYHITVPKAWLLEGRIVPIPYCFQSNYHFLSEMLNVIALALSHNDVVFCKLIQWYSGILMAVATWCFGRSFFSARVAWVAAAIVYLNREIAWISGTGYIGLTHGLYLWLGIFAMIRAAHLRQWRYHAFAGVFFGCAVATKQSGAMFAAIVYVAYLAALAVDARRRPSIRFWAAKALLAGAVALAVTSPWMIKNYVHTGDPFFPFLVKSFDVPHEFTEPATHFTGYYGGLTRYLVWDEQTWPQLLRALKNFNTQVMHSGANMLVVWLLVSGLILMAFRCRTSFALRILIAIGIFGAPWFAWTWSRFFFGLFPAYVLVLVQTLHLVGRGRLSSRWRGRLFALFSLLLLFFYGKTFVRFNYSSSRRGAKALVETRGPILRTEARDRWLTANNWPYPVVQQTNRLLGQYDRLLPIGVAQASPWIDTPFLPNPHSYSEHLLAILWERFADADKMRRWLDDEGITHILLPDDEARDLEAKSRFVTRHLDRLFTQRSVSLYRLRPPLRDEPEAGSRIE